MRHAALEKNDYELLRYLLLKSGMDNNFINNAQIEFVSNGARSYVYKLNYVGESYIKITEFKNSIANFLLKFLRINHHRNKLLNRQNIMGRLLEYTWEADLTPKYLKFGDNYYAEIDEEENIPEDLQGLLIFHMSPSPGFIPEFKNININNLPGKFSRNILALAIRTLTNFDKKIGQIVLNNKIKFPSHEARHLSSFEKIIGFLLKPLNFGHLKLDDLIYKLENNNEIIIDGLYKFSEEIYNKINTELINISKEMDLKIQDYKPENLIQIIGNEFKKIIKVKLFETNIGYLNQDEIILKLDELSSKSVAEYLFYSETLHIFPRTTMFLGRRITQLETAYNIIQDLKNHKNGFLMKILKFYQKFEQDYREIYDLKEGIALYDPDPRNCMYLKEIEKAYILDLTDLARDKRINDLSMFYIWEIVPKDIIDYETLKFVLSEYDNGLRLTNKEIKHLYDFKIAKTLQYIKYWEFFLNIGDIFSIENLNPVFGFQKFWQNLQRVEGLRHVTDLISKSIDEFRAKTLDALYLEDKNNVIKNYTDKFREKIFTNYFKDDNYIGR